MLEMASAITIAWHNHFLRETFRDLKVNTVTSLNNGQTYRLARGGAVTITVGNTKVVCRTSTEECDTGATKAAKSEEEGGSAKPRSHFAAGMRFNCFLYECCLSRQLHQ